MQDFFWVLIQVVSGFYRRLSAFKGLYNVVCRQLPWVEGWGASG